MREYVPGDAEACADLYNERYRRVSSFVPVDAASLHEAVLHPDSFHAEVADGRAIVAVGRDGGVRGWVALCRRRPTADAGTPWEASLRCWCVAPEDGDVVRELWWAVIETVGTARVAMGGSGGLRFLNGGEADLPESTGLAPPLLAAGLQLTGRTLVLQGPVAEMGTPSGPAAIAPADEVASSRALVDGETVGECWVAPASLHSSHHEAAAHAFVHWIGTEPEWRGRGVARQMWAWTCARLRGRGVRQMSLTTPCDNVAAQAFYYRMGLRPVDHVLAWERCASSGR